MMNCDIEDSVRFMEAEIVSGPAMNQCPSRWSQCLKDSLTNLIMHERTDASGCSLPDQTIFAWLNQQFQHPIPRDFGEVSCHLDGEILSQHRTNRQYFLRFLGQAKKPLF